jgi:hypothetical protein
MLLKVASAVEHPVAGRAHRRVRLSYVLQQLRAAAPAELCALRLLTGVAPAVCQCVLLQLSSSHKGLSAARVSAGVRCVLSSSVAVYQVLLQLLLLLLP